MQGFRFPIEHHQRNDQQIVVDLLPPQYTKQTTPPMSPANRGMFNRD